MTRHPVPDERRPPNEGPKAAAPNRAALVAAAREVHAEHGLDAPLFAIARRAGVGQGVLYRHFPDRAALSAAVLEETVCQVEEAACAEGARLAGVLGVLTWHMAESAAFIGLLHGDGTSGGSGIRPCTSGLSERVDAADRPTHPPVPTVRPPSANS